jgi:chromosome segregation ATPase
MLFTTGNLITLGIVAVVLLMYRQLDRDNRSLERVKKYTDKLKDELSGYVDKRSEDLQRYGIELDVQQKAAKELLKHLQGVEEGLNSRAEAIGAIEKRLGEYDAALARLMDMTSKVDENLSRLHDESEFTDSVARKLEAAEKTMSAIEGELPAIKENFTRDNAAALGSFKENVVADIGRRLSETTKVLESAQAQAEASLAKGEAGRKETERQLAAAFEAARTEAEKLEDLAFDKLKESSDAKAARLKETIEEKFREIGQSAKEKAAETQGIVKTMKAETKAETEAILEETEARAKALVAEFKAASISAAEDAKKASTERDALMAKLEEDGRVREAKVIADFEKRLDEYGSEIEGKFAKLESVNVDIGALEAALRGSMAQAEERVENDFAAFGAALKGRNAQFEANFGAETAKLRASMGAVETELDALKSRAYENVSEKLKVFEDDFFADLKARSEAIDSRLVGWKADLDKSLETLAATSAAERTEAEKASLEELKARMAETQAKVLEQLEKMRDRVQGITDGIDAQSGMASESLEALKASVQQDAQEALKNTDAYVEGELSRFTLDSQNRIKAAETNFSSRLAELDKSVGSEEARIAGTREATETACAAYTEGFSASIAEAEAKVRADFAAFQASTKELAESLKGDYEKERDGYMKESQAQRDRISKELSGLADRTAELRQDLSSRISQALEGFSRGYESLLADIAKKQKETEAQADAKLRDFHDAAQDLSLSIEAAKAQALGRVETESARLSQVLSDIDKEQKSYIAETRVFDRTDELKASLTEAIGQMKSDLASLDGRKAEIAEIENQLGRVKRLEDEVNQKVARFLAEKKRIDALEEDFGKLAQVSDSVDKKIEEVTGQSDALTEAESRIRKILELSNDAESKFDRLEKKSEVLDSTTEAVDKNFQAVQGIEKILAAYGAEIKRFPEQVAEIKKSFGVLQADKGKVDEAASKLGELDGIIADTEKRIGETQKAREWLARAETRFEELNRQAQEQLKLLSTILKEEDVGKKDRGAPPSTVQETVRKLSRQGWKTEEIARAVKISRGEVELILELGEKK